MSTKVYQIVTDRILACLDSGVMPWVKPWKGGYSQPYNMFSMNPDKGNFYHGINTMLLWSTGYKDSRWLTFNQAAKAGIEIKEDQKKNSYPVVFWRFLDKKDKAGKVIGQIPVLRYFRVYNAEQCNNVPAAQLNETLVPSENYENCQALVDSFGIIIEHGGGLAAYSLTQDKIMMPEAAYFKDAEGYWATLLHEIVHGTGHENRLGRKVDTQDKKSYAFEELVAEIGSAFLCAHMNVERENLTANHASYIASWKKILSEDPRAVMKASKLARAAADYVLQSCELEVNEPIEEQEEAA